MIYIYRVPNYISIKELAKDDRPREKMIEQGRSALSNAEILAILIGSGTREKSAIHLCQEILASVDNDLNALARLTVQDLMKFNGIGEAKAITIAAALELGRRRKNVLTEKHSKIISSKHAADVLRLGFEDLEHEEFRVLLLNRANQVIANVLISKGGLSATVVDGKVVFKHALSHSASAMILAHNHPSGNLQPSKSDIELTNKLKSFGTFIDCPVLDHLILTNSDYYSFADNGLI